MAPRSGPPIVSRVSLIRGIDGASGHEVVEADETRFVGGEPRCEAPTLRELPAGESRLESPFKLVVPMPRLLLGAKEAPYAGHFGSHAKVAKA